MEDMYAPLAHHMCSARGLSCGGGLQNVHTRPKVASQPAKKKVGRYFKTKWRIGRPWL